MSNEEYLDFLRASLKSNPLVDSEGYINPDYLISSVAPERIRAHPHHSASKRNSENAGKN